MVTDQVPHLSHDLKRNPSPNDRPKPEPFGSHPEHWPAVVGAGPTGDAGVWPVAGAVQNQGEPLPQGWGRGDSER